MNFKRKTDRQMPVRDLSYIAIFTAILSICSWLRLPFIIPITLQSFGVFVSMGLLGGKRSFFVVLLYLFLGSIGLPVFSGFAGGIGYLLGSTGGYIFGFLLPPLLLWLCDNIFTRTNYTFLLSAALGLAGCYAVGTAWYAHFYAHGSLTDIFSICVSPFIVPDLMKLLAAYWISVRLKKQIRL